MTGRQVVSCIAAIVMATAVLPPAAACAVHKRRVSRAGRDVDALAARLSTPGRVTDAVLCGPGRIPTDASPAAQPWLAVAHARLSGTLAGMEIPADPWGNCYLVHDRWIISAGPNGRVETAFNGTAASGDDIAAHAR